MDHSIYENSNHERQQRIEGIAFGRITRVYEEERLVEVKTFFGTGAKNDNHIPRCQWLNTDGNPEGDESGAIPRADSFCLVFFVSGEPFAFGFYNPLNDSGTALVGDQGDFQVLSGDRFLRTSAGNYIILRTNGIIEILSTEGCRTRYFPKGQGQIKDLIETLCKNYEFTCDGGTIDWKLLDERKRTLYKGEWRDNLQRDTIITEHKGEVGGNVFHRIEYGTGATGTARAEADKVFKSKVVNKDGETTDWIRPAGSESGGVKVNKKPSGEMTATFNDKTTIKIEPSGKTTIDVTNGKVKIVLGEDGKITIDASADVNMKNNGKLNVEASGKAVIKADKIDLDGGGGAVENVLSYPSAISDFTGLPVQSFSSTVKVSK